jgi:mannose/cellobiose epimerase-like protein (N-acyl-D-glucosamine 2-epimerase family)
MTRRLTVILWLFAVFSPARPILGQYVVRSPYLSDPGLVIPYVDSCAAFWSKAYDATYGGYYTNVGRSGNIKTPYDKYVVTESRDAYGFARAFMLTGNEYYLTMARQALDFMYQHHWDTVYGGWMNRVDRAGNRVYATGTKTAFDQHYALLGPAAYYEATQDTVDWKWLMQGYSSNESRLWDATPSTQGFFDNATYNWSSRSGKSFNATVDAVTTHILSLYLMTQDTVYRTRLKDLAGQMLQRLWGTMPQQAIGFVEGYGSDWSWNNSSANNNTRTIMGHVLKTAWCLGRIHQLFPDTTYVLAAESLMSNVWNKGYDRFYGGPYKDYDRTTGVMMMYGQDTAKAWWQMEQAMTGGLMLYDITRKDRYLEMADGTVDFFMKYFVDHTYGDVYSDRFRNGGAITAWGDDKGNSGKAGYHSIEFGYYLYLYGKLFLKMQPVTLHYRFQPRTGEARDVPLNPLALAGTKYVIRNVTANGTPYADFDHANRTLHLPAGVGGLFDVTFERLVTRVPEGVEVIPAMFALLQNYPNPFNPRTRIGFVVTTAGGGSQDGQTPASGKVDVFLSVYDLLGREVVVLVDEPRAPGTYEVDFDGTGLASGVYLYRLRSGASVMTKTMLLLR